MTKWKTVKVSKECYEKLNEIQHLIVRKGVSGFPKNIVSLLLSKHGRMILKKGNIVRAGLELLEERLRG